MQNVCCMLLTSAGVHGQMLLGLSSSWRICATSRACGLQLLQRWLLPPFLYTLCDASVLVPRWPLIARGALPVMSLSRDFLALLLDLLMPCLWCGEYDLCLCLCLCLEWLLSPIARLHLLLFLDLLGPRLPSMGLPPSSILYIQMLLLMPCVAYRSTNLQANLLHPSQYDASLLENEPEGKLTSLCLSRF